MIKGVIFDWGGVVIDWQNDTLYRHISKRFNIDLDYIRKRIENDLLRLVQIGEIDGKEMWKRFFSSLDMELPEDYERLWLEKFEELCKINEKVMDMVKRLKEREYKTAILSDNEASHAAWGKKIGGFENFDIVVNSFEVKMLKPDEKIYNLTLDRLGLKAEECIFIDDKERNLPPAKKLGIHTIHFKNAEQLREDLAKVLGHGV